MIEDDQALLMWIKENRDEGVDTLHLFVEAENHPLEPLLEEPEVQLPNLNTISNGVTDSDDDTYEVSDINIEVSGSSDIDEFIVSESKGDRDNSSDYDTENSVDGIYEYNYSEDRTYLDRAYVGKIYEGPSEGKIALKRGMLFANVVAFREVLTNYVIQEGFEIVKVRNERTRIIAICAGRGCEWYLHASTNPNEVTFEIKVYEGKHTCVKSTINSCVTSTWIATKMAVQFRADPNLSYETIREHLLSTYGVEVSRTQMYRARKKAREQIEGNHAKTYSKLRQYAHMVLEANPGSIAKLQVERVDLSSNPMFKGFFCVLML